MKKTLSIILSIYMLAVFVGFSVNTHFCNGLAVQSAIQITHQDLGCGMSIDKSACERDASYSPNCCSNENYHFELKESYHLDHFQLKKAQSFINYSVFEIASSSTFKAISRINFPIYKPPLRWINKTILHQVFRI